MRTARFLFEPLGKNSLSQLSRSDSVVKGQGNSVPLQGSGQRPDVTPVTPFSHVPSWLFYFSIGSRLKGVSMCAFNRYNRFKKNDPQKT